MTTWTTLLEQVPGVDTSRVEAWLSTPREHAHAPWYLQAITAVGAWIAAAFFMSFLFRLELIDWNSSASFFVWGVILTGAAIGVARRSGSVFLGQLALTASGVGQTLLLVGVGKVADNWGAVALTEVGLAAALYFAYPDALHRFLTCGVAWGLVVGWFVEQKHGEWLSVLVGVQAVTLAGLTARSLRPALLPLVYAFAAALPATVLVMQLWPEGSLWPPQAILGGWLLWLCRWAGAGGERRDWQALAYGAVVALAVFSTPGILTAVGLLILGFGRQDAFLTTLAVAFLAVFIVLFYYHMEVDLATKSWILMASGILMLGARAMLPRWSVS